MVEIALIILAGIAIVIALGWVLIVFRAHQFSRAGCCYQPSSGPGVPSGWLARDENDDWVLWDDRNQVALRCSANDPPSTPWRLSSESRKEFLALARRENAWHRSGESRVGDRRQGEDSETRSTWR